MSEKEKEIEMSDAEIVETLHNDNIMPSMNISVPKQRQEGDISTLVDDDSLIGIYDEVCKNLRSDREEIDGLLNRFADMVFNDGDASNASKEAVVNLIKLKQDTADKMTKIADLMTRLKMKEKDTLSGWQKAQYNQTNNVSINTNKRELIEEIESKVKGRKNDKKS